MIATLLDKVNVLEIIVGHWGTLRDAGAARPSRHDKALFYVIPALITLIMVVFNVHLTDTTIGVLATALSILAGLLFNLLVLLHTLTMPSRGVPHDDIVKELCRQLHLNIAYAIIVSLVTLIPLIWASYFGPLDWRRTIAGDISIYLTIHFALTMSMVLKRMDGMLQERTPL